jgi:hypothetical protein
MQQRQQQVPPGQHQVVLTGWGSSHHHQQQQQQQLCMYCCRVAVLATHANSSNSSRGSSSLLANPACKPSVLLSSLTEALPVPWLWCCRLAGEPAAQAWQEGPAQGALLHPVSRRPLGAAVDQQQCEGGEKEGGEGTYAIGGPHHEDLVSAVEQQQYAALSIPAGLTGHKWQLAPHSSHPVHAGGAGLALSVTAAPGPPSPNPHVPTPRAATVPHSSTCCPPLSPPPLQLSCA